MKKVLLQFIALYCVCFWATYSWYEWAYVNHGQRMGDTFSIVFGALVSSVVLFGAYYSLRGNE